ncbi:MAG: dihydroorotate dehydrogenase electron transfer subunit [Spirochaetes bacterium]|nr:dihydroorotate dehydrogenase electron transfer subunit [Spirochaetota bacterium]
MALLVERPLRLCSAHYLLRIRHTIRECMPGQFVNLRGWSGHDPLLRRPFSVFNRESDVLELVIRVVGKGTEILSRMEPGEIDLLGPMGRGFTIMENRSVLLAGGGVGNAPLHYLARMLKERGNRVSCIYGARSREYIYREKEFREICDSVIFTTDDGSFGTAGTVTDAAREILSHEAFDRIYSCGPTAMMRSMVELAGSAPIEISVENYFGCGIGLCMGCTIETTQGMKRACIDGPVFDGSSIKWESLC